jgi:hypothetical protein
MADVMWWFSKFLILDANAVPIQQQIKPAQNGDLGIVFCIGLYLFGGFFKVLHGYPTLFMRRPFSMIDAGEERRCEVGG